MNLDLSSGICSYVPVCCQEQQLNNKKQQHYPPSPLPPSPLLTTPDSETEQRQQKQKRQSDRLRVHVCWLVLVVFFGDNCVQLLIENTRVCASMWILPSNSDGKTHVGLWHQYTQPLTQTPSTGLQFNSKTLIIPQGAVLLWSWRARKKYIKLSYDILPSITAVFSYAISKKKKKKNVN